MPLLVRIWATGVGQAAGTVAAVAVAVAVVSARPKLRDEQQPNSLLLEARGPSWKAGEAVLNKG